MANRLEAPQHEVSSEIGIDTATVSLSDLDNLAQRFAEPAAPQQDTDLVEPIPVPTKIPEIDELVDPVFTLHKLPDFSNVYFDHLLSTAGGKLLAEKRKRLRVPNGRIAPDAKILDAPDDYSFVRQLIESLGDEGAIRFLCCVCSESNVQGCIFFVPRCDEEGDLFLDEEGKPAPVGSIVYLRELTTEEHTQLSRQEQMEREVSKIDSFSGDRESYIQEYIDQEFQEAAASIRALAQSRTLGSPTYDLRSKLISESNRLGALANRLCTYVDQQTICKILLVSTDAFAHYCRENAAQLQELFSPMAEAAKEISESVQTSFRALAEEIFTYMCTNTLNQDLSTDERATLIGDAFPVKLRGTNQVLQPRITIARHGIWKEKVEEPFDYASQATTCMTAIVDCVREYFQGHYESPTTWADQLIEVVEDVLEQERRHKRRADVITIFDRASTKVPAILTYLKTTKLPDGNTSPLDAQKLKEILCGTQERNKMFLVTTLQKAAASSDADDSVHEALGVLHDDTIKTIFQEVQPDCTDEITLEELRAVLADKDIDDVDGAFEIAPSKVLELIVDRRKALYAKRRMDASALVAAIKEQISKAAIPGLVGSDEHVLAIVELCTNIIVRRFGKRLYTWSEKTLVQNLKSELDSAICGASNSTNLYEERKKSLTVLLHYVNHERDRS